MSTHPPRFLVTVASRHGSTAEIAAAVARDLQESAAGRRCGLTAVAVPVERDPDPSSYDAVVLGSGVHAGRWLEPARHHAATHATALRSRPVWLLSSGPIGAPPFPRTSRTTPTRSGRPWPPVDTGCSPGDWTRISSGSANGPW